jgi:signal transduction histidine kinase
MAQFVIEEADRLSRTVGRYLQFARGGEQDVGRGDAIAALDQTLALLEGELAARKITVERFRGAGDSATVRLDPESLKQVYLNLLLNAADASPSGGTLEVRDRAEPGRYEVEITDHGRGIAPEMLARLGSPFLTTKAQGSGLGLFLTRRLVQSSGGELVIKSEVGSGTTCVVKLPRAGD